MVRNLDELRKYLDRLADKGYVPDGQNCPVAKDKKCLRALAGFINAAGRETRRLLANWRSLPPLP